jgi:hypothetical protein
MSAKQALRVPGHVVFVLGAGVDVALGMPVMNTLFRDLHAFAKYEGKAVDKALRKHVRVRFNLAAYAGDEGEGLGEKLLGSHVHLLPVIQNALKRHPNAKDDNVRTLKTIIDQLQEIAHANELKEDTVSQLQRIAGDTTSGLTADTLLDTEHIALQPVARQAMRKIFTGVLADMPALTAAERAAFETVVAALSNFEEMLGDCFAGYFTKNPGEQKRYFYLSWLLWAYIRVREREGLSKRDQSFYKTLSEVGRGSEIITFNYTDFFLGNTRPRNGYFHGDSKSYIRFDTRDYVSDDKMATDADTADKIADFIEGLPVDWTGDIPKTYLPGIVPPLSVKPIICTEYLERWYACGQLIKKAKTIVIAGYSFNVADEHFNDLIRKQNPTARLLVINPSIEPVIEQVCRITAYDKAQLGAAKVNGLECMKGGRLTFIKAKAEEIKTPQLSKLLNH